MEVDDTAQDGPDQSDRGSIPSRIDVIRLAAARVHEIQALTQAIEDPQRTGLVFQKLPRHMRRRAMSRNPKRLPARLRAAHIQQMAKSGPQPVSKRPSRKYRRRPSNLLSEYNRRQRTHVWLETHIWHAKRFHMTKKWGYHLAFSPNDRSFRACYRASTSHCLLQDVSYLCCIQLVGKQEQLINGLNKHASSSCGLTFAARAFHSGAREGSLFFYAPDSYPCGAVGPVSFLWRPVNSDSSPDPLRTLWLWSHSSYHSEIVDHLTNTFELRPAETESSAMKTLVSDSVKLNLLKDALNRFRLTGPLSHAVLQQSLKIVSNASESHNDLWSSLDGVWSPAMMSAGTALSLVVCDPRFSLPSKRTKAETTRKDEWSTAVHVNVVPPLDSGIWDPDLRESVTKAKLSDAALNAERAKLLVPGSDIAGATSPSVPILLIQRPGNRDESAARVGYGSGWDVIVPSGWAMPFWLAFVFRGARSAGLREANCLAFESGKNYILNPDTGAGRAEDGAVEKVLKEKHFRLPPDKRPNFIKLGMSSPFRCPWLQLLQDWDGHDVDVSKIFVLRDLREVANLRESLSKIAGRVGSKDGASSIFNGGEWSSVEPGCLVAVRVELIGRGSVADLSSVCVPGPEDIEAMANERSVAPESSHDDSKHEERRNLQRKHEKLLKSLRRQRVREKREKDDDEDSLRDKTVRCKDPPTRLIVDEHAAKMQKLWLPDEPAVKHVASRTTIGFLTKGDNCLSNGLSRGVGYLACSSLRYLAQTWASCGHTSDVLRKLCRTKTDSHLIVLVRSPHCHQYWPARLHLCTDLRY